MLVMQTTENPAYSISELICSQQPVGFYDLALAVDPLWLYGVKPRTLLGQQAAHDPHSAAALLHSAVVRSEPAPDLLGDVPGSVVPDEDHDLLPSRSELLAAPLKELGRYAAHGPSVHESQPRFVDLGQVEPLAGDGFGLGIVLGDRPLDHAVGLLLLGEAAQGGQRNPAPPALITEADGPPGVGVGHLHQSVASEASLFSFLQGVWGGDPAFRPLPAYPEQAREGGAYGLPRNPPLGEPFLEGGLGGHLQGPQATVVSELPRGAVEHPPQGFGPPLVEGGVDALGARGAAEFRDVLKGEGDGLATTCSPECVEGEFSRVHLPASNAE